MVLISTYTLLVSKTLISIGCNLRLPFNLRCSRNVRGILCQILTPLLERDNNS